MKSEYLLSLTQSSSCRALSAGKWNSGTATMMVVARTGSILARRTELIRHASNLAVLLGRFYGIDN